MCANAGVLQKARKSLIHQQPGGLAGQLRGRAAQQSPALPPNALAGPVPPSAQQQGGSKHAQQADAHSRPHPGSATAVVGTAAGNDGRIGTGVAVTNSRIQSGSAEIQQGGGMSWNPVRLSSPFEKATEPTGSKLTAYTSYALQPSRSAPCPLSPTKMNFCPQVPYPGWIPSPALPLPLSLTSLPSHNIPPTLHPLAPSRGSCSL